MLWFLLSLLTAFAVATSDALLKKFFSHLSHHEMLGYPLCYSLPFFVAAMFFIATPPLNVSFWWSFVASIPVNGLAFMLHVKAIKTYPLSLTLPFLAFTPAFMIFTALFFLNEMPNVWGVAGIMITCVGSYVLNIDPDDRRFLTPVRAIFKNRGSKLMLMVAFLFSIGAVIGKVGILNSSPEFFSIAFFAVNNLVMLILFRIFGKIRFRTFAAHPLKGLLLGSLLIVHVLCHGYAISMTKAAYMITVKRSAILIGILYGRFLFRERNISVRFAGAALMFAGMALILIRG